MKQEKIKLVGNNIKSILANFADARFSYKSQIGDSYMYVFEEFVFLCWANISTTLVVDIIDGREAVIQLVVVGGGSGFLKTDLMGQENSVLNGIEGRIKKIAVGQKWDFKIIR